jgi:hypothetical protein
MEIQSIQPFLHYLGQVRERTMRVARSSSRSEPYLRRALPAGKGTAVNSQFLRAQ